MSSINTHFTFHYSQPDAYHFCHDSVFLAREVFARQQKAKVHALRVLDLCAGCGIVGLDFMFHCQKELGQMPESCDFVEVQEEYYSHFVLNAGQLGTHSTRLRFLVENYSKLLDRHEQYDLILCNPPYFHLGQGKVSPSEFKNRCRFFMDSDLPTLIRSIQQSLAPQGRAYVLLRDGSDHGFDLFRHFQILLSPLFLARKCEPIRSSEMIEVSNLKRA